MTIAEAPPRLACVDVDYRNRGAVVGCVLFGAWPDAAPTREVTATAPASEVAPYVPGELYRRELPLLSRVLAAVGHPLDVVVVDGNVWLDGADAPGLGAHLWEALGRTTAVIGVAKTRYVGAPAVLVSRGTSARPLYVTAAGVTVDAAADHVRAMHGEFRLPTLCSRVDRLCRTAPLP